MQIGIDIRNIGKKRTGDETVFFNLTKNLALLDAQNKYKLFTDTVEKDALEKIKEKLKIKNHSNFEIISLPTKNKFIWNFWTLPKYLRSQPVDIYLTQYITPFFVPKKIKIFTIIHDVSFKVYSEFIKWSDLFLLNLLIPLSLKRANKIIAVSLFTKNEIIKFYRTNPQKIEYIHNAVEKNFPNQDFTEEATKKVRNKYKLPEKYILYLGTFQPRKNILVLIEAFSLIKKDFPEINLVLAGGKSHNYDKRIDGTIKENDLEKSVFFSGYVEEKDKNLLIRNAEVFCSPSLYEGFGIPILEAMLLSTPVICSDIPAHQEVAGEAALFFNPDIPGNLAQKIREVLRNDILKNDLIKKGNIQIEKFSWQKTTQKMLGLFQES